MVRAEIPAIPSRSSLLWVGARIGVLGVLTFVALAPKAAKADAPDAPGETSAQVAPQAPSREKPAAADVPALPADETLSQLIAESLSASPEIARALASLRALEERVPQAAAPPDPMLQVGMQNDGFTSIELGRMGTSYVSVMASQTFPWPGKLGVRRELAELDAGAAKETVARVRLTTEAEVRRAYLALLLVRDRLGLLGQLEGIWQQSFGVARARYESSDGAQSDVLRAQLELNRIRQRRLGLHAEERGRVQALNRLRAHPLDEPIASVGHVRDLPAPARFAGAFSVDHALEQSPELSGARLGLSQASRAVALAETAPFPDLTVSAGLMIRGALPPMWLLTVGAPVPVFIASKQARAVAESEAGAEAAKQGVAVVDQLLRLRTEERRTAFSSLLEVIRLYEQGLLVQSQATTESTLAQYQVGKVSFASVLEANAGFIADQDGYLEALADAHRVLIANAELSLEPVGTSAGSADVVSSAPPSGAAAPPSSM